MSIGLRSVSAFYKLLYKSTLLTPNLFHKNFSKKGNNQCYCYKICFNQCGNFCEKNGLIIS